MNSSRAKAQAYQVTRDALLGKAAKQSRFDRLNEDISAANQKFINDQEGQQQAIIQRQDEKLTDITEDVKLLGHMGRQIHDELDEQNEYVLTARCI